MAEGHLILLSNFYGSYLDKSHFMSDVIVNNAGIEQLASLGVDKLKQVKARIHPKDELYVLVVAGLTDVLIKSVEQNKNKLEITPNSAQLLETKMEWAHKLLADEGATVFWAVMPPISLRMYHQSEGWNVNRIPGMSSGLDKEQVQLNQLMLSYRNLCHTLNKKRATKVFIGPFFTDMVAEVTSDKRSINLNVSYFEDDGISPNPTLVSNWNSQLVKLKAAIEQSIKPARNRSDPWDLPPNRKLQVDNTPSRSFGDSSSGRDSRRASNDRRPYARERERDPSYDARYGDTNERKRLKVQSPPSSIPSLLDFRPQTSLSTATSNTQPFSSAAISSDQPLSTAMQLLAAASLQLGGNNVPSGNMQAMLEMIMNQQKKEEEAKRKLEDQRQAELTRRLEEEKLLAVQRRLEEEKRREEMRRAEEERRRRIEEENRLREIQLAAQRALEKQQLEQQERLQALQNQLRQAQYAAEQQAQRELMEAARRAQSGGGPVPPLMAVQTNKPSALDRINEKLLQDRKRKDATVSPKDSRPDPKIARDPAWKNPVVLFSFINRNGCCKPLRGISGSKVPMSKLAESDNRSRGQWVYQTFKGPNPTVNFLKLKLKRPGELSEFETKVASYNNKLYELMLESNRLMNEGRRYGYNLTAEAPVEKSKRPSPSRLAEKKRSMSPRSNEKSTDNQQKDRDSKPKSDKSDSPMPGKPSASSKSDRFSAVRAATDTKESSLPPAESRKPRWDKSDESEEELLWEDEIEHSKTNEEEERQSVASFKDEPATATAATEEVNQEEAKEEGGDAASTKTPNEQEAVEEKADVDTEEKEPEAENARSPMQEEKKAGEGYLTVDEVGVDANTEDQTATTSANDVEADEDPDGVDDFVTIDEAN